MNLVEYAIEALCLGAFMVSATLVTALFELPLSPIHQAIAEPLLRRLAIGIAMALTLIAIVYSPLGMRSGAHLNPSVTLTFWRLKKIRALDACFYILAQAFGAISGIWLAGVLLGTAIANPSVNYIATVPSFAGEMGAFLAEFGISLGMMTLILQVSNNPKISQLTGLFCGLLVIVYITFEAPISGMSMNPARSLGSAIPSQAWHGFWVYCIAPPLGMLLASELYLRLNKRKSRAELCCKLCPNSTTPCISPVCCQMCKL
ncbi:MIP/aquaporin family protein [Pseudanabaena sp. 'Roaring Creek']|uniref:MIP/aquaporin family protein n=1 Tax=Pseudanabaena sp. 'Roaring Creek' TaxID=1681830 RepID=UPI0006D7C09D|nr:aquaporin [Pseudanabaena sp. 'Roaring Creek']